MYLEHAIKKWRRLGRHIRLPHQDAEKRKLSKGWTRSESGLQVYWAYPRITSYDKTPIQVMDRRGCNEPPCFTYAKLMERENKSSASQPRPNQSSESSPWVPETKRREPVETPKPEIHYIAEAVHYFSIFGVNVWERVELEFIAAEPPSVGSIFDADRAKARVNSRVALDTAKLGDITTTHERMSLYFSPSKAKILNVQPKEARPTETTTPRRVKLLE
jgi:hypothetical protein